MTCCPSNLPLPCPASCAQPIKAIPNLGVSQEVRAIHGYLGDKGHGLVFAAIGDGDKAIKALAAHFAPQRARDEAELAAGLTEAQRKARDVLPGWRPIDPAPMAQFRLDAPDDAAQQEAWVYRIRFKPFTGLRPEALAALGPPSPPVAGLPVRGWWWAQLDTNGAPNGLRLVVYAEGDDVRATIAVGRRFASPDDKAQKEEGAYRGAEAFEALAGRLAAKEAP
ncbi:MAG: hypothetical protein KC620_18215 [Myxococcales bacterium]|nr:hypothetical protein [Myxococcales bacterium]